jgi:hypothetical protein
VNHRLCVNRIWQRCQPLEQTFETQEAINSLNMSDGIKWENCLMDDNAS